MKKQMYNIAVYVDMENVASTEFALEDLMSALLRADDDHNCIFVIKAAYGNQTTGKKTLKEQLIDHNFTLIDTPKISGKSGRLDALRPTCSIPIARSTSSSDRSLICKGKSQPRPVGFFVVWSISGQIQQVTWNVVVAVKC